MKYLWIVLLLFLSVNSFAAENTNRSQAETACQQPGVLFCENFEDKDHHGWLDFFDLGTNHGGISCDSGCDYPYAGFNSSSAIALRLPPNDPDSLYTDNYWGGGLNVNDTVYVRWRTYFSPNFSFNFNVTKHWYLVSEGRGNQFAFWFAGNGEGGATGEPIFHLYCNQFHLDALAQQRCYNSGGDMWWGPNLQPGFRVVGGQWYEFEVAVTPNPSGQQFGGRLQMWVDGQKIADWQDVSIRLSSVTQAWSGIYLTSYHGGPDAPHPDQYVLYDDIIVSTNPIGTSAPPEPEPIPDPIPDPVPDPDPIPDPDPVPCPDCPICPDPVVCPELPNVKCKKPFSGRNVWVCNGKPLWAE